MAYMCKINPKRVEKSRNSTKNNQNNVNNVKKTVKNNPKMRKFEKNIRFVLKIDFLNPFYIKFDVRLYKSICIIHKINPFYCFGYFYFIFHTLILYNITLSNLLFYKMISYFT